MLSLTEKVLKKRGNMDKDIRKILIIVMISVGIYFALAIGAIALLVNCKANQVLIGILVTILVLQIIIVVGLLIRFLHN